MPEEDHLVAIQTAVLNSVRRRLCADKPLAFLLSGGVDSSLVAALSAKILGKPIRTFCCSLKGEDGKGVGTDLAYSRMVAEHIGSSHTEVLFTTEEGLAAIPDVIERFVAMILQLLEHLLYNIWYVNILDKIQTVRLLW